jgi:hypothetical protein
MNIIIALSGLIPGLFYRKIFKISQNLRYFIFESIKWPENQNFLALLEIFIFLIEFIFIIISFLGPFLIIILIFYNYLNFGKNPQFYIVLPTGYMFFLILGILIKRKIL